MVQSWFYRLLLIPFFLIGAESVWAQNHTNQLKNKKQQLEKQIAYTNQLINNISKNKRNTLYALQLINNKINRRMELIAALKREIYGLNDSLEISNRAVERFSYQLTQMKNEYARIAYYLYKNNNPYTRLIFLFSAKDFNQAYQRLRYMDEMAAYIRKQASRIKTMEAQKNVQISNIKKKKAEKNRLLDQETTQLSTLQLEQQRKKRVRRKLSGQEVALRASLRRKRKESKKLEQQITLAIAKATAAKRVGKTKRSYALTPMEKKLSASFAANKGKLPWPVKKGIIAQTYGVHNHPVLKNVHIRNNGVNIATSAGASARAVFAGKVVSIVKITATNIAIIVKHGNYFSVYSGLDKVYVSLNKAVKGLQNIGEIHTNLQGKTELHFEIWKGKFLQNPAWWLAGK